MKTKINSKNIKLILALTLMTALVMPSNAQEFKPSGKMFGQFFGDLYYKAVSDTTAGAFNKYGSGNSEFSNVKTKNAAFTARRLYLGYQYNISPDFTSKIILESNDAILTNAGDKTVFVKLAEVEWKNIIPRASIFIGQIFTPAFPMTTEKIWNYRAVEKTISDMQKLTNAVDLGIRVTGTIDTAGLFGYSLMVGNGRGAKPEDNGTQKYYGCLNAQLLKKKLYLEIYGDYEDVAAKFRKGYSGKITTKGFVAYKSAKLTVGIEVPYQIQGDCKINTDPLNGKKDTLALASMGFSFFAYGTIVKEKLNVFGRFDTYQTDSQYKKGDNSRSYDDTFMTVGFDWTPRKNMHFIPNIYISVYKDKREKPANYNIASMAGLYYERSADVIPRLTYSFIF